MIASFIIFLISIVVKLSIDLSLEKFPFLEVIAPYTIWLVVGCGVIFLIFTLIGIGNKIKKGK